MEQQDSGILALYIFVSPFVTFILIVTVMGWLKKKRAYPKPIQAQINASKISPRRYPGRKLQEWITVGDYDILVHKLIEQIIITDSKNERIIYAEVEYRNQSGKDSLSCRRNQWRLYEEDGYNYESESQVTAPNLYTDKKYFGGDRFINPGMNARGWFAFRVPEQAKIITLQFITAFIGTKSTDISVENTINVEMTGRLIQSDLPSIERETKSSSLDERAVNPIREMSRIAVDILSLPARGFKESFRSIKWPQTLIYDSEWCRIRLDWDGWDYMVGNSIQIQYGRLHAPDDEAIMVWNDEICHCWHRLNYALHFLDGSSPAQAAEMRNSTPITKPFYLDEIRERFDRRQPEWLAQMHLTIWQHYDKRLFELFDLRQPELWRKYRDFLKNVYDIEGRIPYIDPPLDIIT